jgi:hypothetical protein
VFNKARLSGVRAADNDTAIPVADSVPIADVWHSPFLRTLPIVDPRLSAVLDPQSPTFIPLEGAARQGQ